MGDRLRVHRLASLPPLAWCLHRGEPSRPADLWCGAWVECGEGFFWEGAWCGGFDSAGFDRAPDRMGSGGRLTGDGLLLVPPSHTLERIHLLRRGKEVLASNSLPFLLACAGADLDPSYPFYRDDFWSLLGGARACVRRLRTKGRDRVELIYADPLLVAGDRVVRRPVPPADPDWRSYEEYAEFLAGSFRLLVANASDPRRRHRFEPVATLSTGYDSPASAALAVEAGCREALTFRLGSAYKSRGEILLDSGAEIGRRLGLRVTEVRYAGREAVPETTAAEIAACGDAFDLKLTCLEPHVRGRLLVTGIRGGAAWDLDPARPFDPFACLDPSGTSLGEWRMRAGVIPVPVPLLGVRFRRHLWQLSRSEAMRPWMLGIGYDRPIPRRILEERGVPRGAFGRIKLGSFDSIQFENQGPTPWAGYEAFHLRWQESLGVHVALELRVRHHLGRLHRNLWRLTRRFPGWSPIPARRRYQVPWPGRSASVVPWGVAVLRQRYRDSLDEVRGHADGAGSRSPREEPS